MKHALMALLLVAAAAGPAAAQSWDNSGNSLLNGTYYFREVFYVASGDSNGDLSQAIAVFGNITFNGAGTYTMICSVADSSLGDGTCLAWLQYYYGTSATLSGTYSISASGYGFLSAIRFRRRISRLRASLPARQGRTSSWAAAQKAA